MRKTLASLALSAALAFSSGCIKPNISYTPRFSQNAGYRAIEIEHSDKAKAYQKLDNMISECLAELSEKVPQTPKEAEAELSKIYEIKKKHFDFKESPLFTDGMVSGNIECYDSVLIDLSVADIKEWPVKAVHVPDHLLLAWEFEDGEVMYWQTTSAKTTTREELFRDYDVPDHSAKIGAYLRNISDKELGSFMHQIAARKKDMRLEHKIDLLTKAIELDPRNPGAYLERGKSFMLKKEYEKAIEDLNWGIDLDPKDEKLFILRGMAKSYSEDHKGAIYDLMRALELDQDNPKTYYFLGSVHSRIKDWKKTERYLTKAIGLDNTRTGYYLERSIARLYLGDEEGSESDRKKEKLVEKIRKVRPYGDITETNKKMIDFPEHIPGAAKISKFYTPGAEYCLVHIRQSHFNTGYDVSGRWEKKISFTQDNIYKILSFLSEKGEDSAYAEGFYGKDAEDVVDLEQHTKNMFKCMPGIEKIWKEDKMKIYPAENGLVLRYWLKKGETVESLADHEEFFEDREDALLFRLAGQEDAMPVAVFGGAHCFGGKDSFTDYPTWPLIGRLRKKDNIAAWNNNSPERFSLIEITPEGY